jgi:hypothetical protein
MIIDAKADSEEQTLIVAVDGEPLEGSLNDAVMLLKGTMAGEAPGVHFFALGDTTILVPALYDFIMGSPERKAIFTRIALDEIMQERQKDAEKIQVVQSIIHPQKGLN